MLKRIIFSFLLLCFSIPLCAAATLNKSNYKSFIGKKVKFSEILPSKQHYKIGRKKLSTKKYRGKVSLLSNIELDKKGNIIIFLTTSFEKNKEKTIKIKTKAKEVIFQNISILTPPIPKRITSPKTSNSLYARRNTSSVYQYNGLPIFGGFVIFIIFILSITIWHKVSTKNLQLLEEVTDIKRGEPSEHDLILKLCHAGFSPKYIFHDLYIPIGNNRFSQIDLLLVSSVGLIVFEIKDYSGWIFGNEKQRHWTQVLNYGQEKYRFYNPIMQNNQHIKHLKSYLGQNIPCFSVIVFYGNCTLKDISCISQNTYITKNYHVMQVINEILTTEPSISYASHIIPLLQDTVHNGNDPIIRQHHINNIHNLLEKD